jgi:tRNA(Leu) C34 or U34 (ribose-2'-O)-methylase TrmL
MKKEIPRGELPAVILIDPKYPHNVGAALRACSCFGLKQLWWTGSRVTIDPVKGERLPREERMKGYKEVALCPCEYPLDYFDGGSGGAVPVAVEVRKKSEPLTTFDHPDNAVYVFGPEDGSIPKAWLHLCHRFVHIPANHCLNLATAVAVVLAHRRMSRQLTGKEPILPLQLQLKEHRGPASSTPILDAMGWDGK